MPIYTHTEYICCYWPTAFGSNCYMNISHEFTHDSNFFGNSMWNTQFSCYHVYCSYIVYYCTKSQFIFIHGTVFVGYIFDLNSQSFIKSAIKYYRTTTIHPQPVFIM